MNVLIISQARLGSTRFPRKVLERVNGKSILSIHLHRLKKVKLASNIVVATTFENGVKKLIDEIKKSNISFFQGSTLDVLDRYYQAAYKFKSNYIVRVTSDCPLIDPKLIDKIINFCLSNNLDYCSNTLEENFPDGQDIEVFRFKCLLDAWKKSFQKSDREHVTPYIKRNSTFFGGKVFKSKPYPIDKNYGNIRMTIDEPEDLSALNLIIQALGIDCDWEEYTSFILKNKKSINNQQIPRSHNYLDISDEK